MNARKYLPGLIFAAAQFAAISSSLAEETIELSPASQMALGVETATVSKVDASVGVEAPAMIIAPFGAIQSATTPYDGMIVDILAAPGRKIEAGDELAIIQSNAYADGIADLEARELKKTHKAHLAKRADELLKIGLRSDQEAEEAHHEAAEAQISFEALRTQLQYVEPGNRPGVFVLTSPAAGQVTHIYANASDGLRSGATVASILTGDVFWARAQISERNASTLRTGQTVEISSVPAAGRIVSVDPEIDPETRSLDVIVELPSVQQWRLGSMVTLSFSATPGAGALLVPARAIVRMDDVEYIFIRTENGFRPTPVEVISRSRQNAFIRGDVASGDQVVVSGLAALKNIASGV